MAWNQASYTCQALCSLHPAYDSKLPRAAFPPHDLVTSIIQCERGCVPIHAQQLAFQSSQSSWLMQARPAGLHRQCLFGGLRIGLYDPVKSFYVKTLGIDPTQDAPFFLKVASGLTTGALGIAIASPTDLVKVRDLWQPQLSSV